MTKPWDLLNSDLPRASDELAHSRLDTCKECIFLLHMTNQCLKCGCFMNLKVKLQDSTCPMNKW